MFHTMVKRKKVYIIFIIFGLFFIYYMKENDEIKNQTKYSINTLKREIFISSDYIFNNEGLNQPLINRYNTITKEIVVLDRGNSCIYFFDLKGTFLRKSGRHGQGPGDLLGPRLMEINNFGDIYIWEYDNIRFSHYSKDGEFINIIKNTGLGALTYFSFSENNEILTHISGRGHYISILSDKGEVIKDIGKLDVYNNKVFINATEQYGNVILIRETKDVYIVFVKHLPIIKIFNKNGNLIKEHKLDNKELGIKEYFNPEKLKYPLLNGFYFDAIYRNNNYYLLTWNYRDIKERDKYEINILDKNFNIIEKSFLPLEKPYKNTDHHIEFIVEQNCFIIPLCEESISYKFFR